MKQTKKEKIKNEILKKLWIKDEDAMSIEWDGVSMPVEEMVEELVNYIFNY